MDLTYLLFLQGEPDPKRDEPPRRDAPDPKRDEPTPMQPLKPQPATPDANPIDPRVGMP